MNREELIESAAQAIYEHSGTTDDGVTCLGCDEDVNNDLAKHQARIALAVFEKAHSNNVAAHSSTQNAPEPPKSDIPHAPMSRFGGKSMAKQRMIPDRMDVPQMIARARYWHGWCIDNEIQNEELVRLRYLLGSVIGHLQDERDADVEVGRRDA